MQEDWLPREGDGGSMAKLAFEFSWTWCRLSYSVVVKYKKNGIPSLADREGEWHSE